jgi:CrcB protein
LDKYLWIGLGGFLGANARYLVGAWALHRWGANVPVGTFIVNVTGSFLLGLMLTFGMSRLALDPRWQLSLAVGFLGAYTTFSTFAFESSQLLLAGNWRLGLLNLLANNAVCLVAAVAGVLVGRNL